MIQLRGLLRRKLIKPEKVYPRFRIREPRHFIIIPEIKDEKKVDITYPLLEPWASVRILWDEKDKKLKYHVIEPELTESEKKLFMQLSKALSEKIDTSMDVIDKEKLIDYIERKFKEVLVELKIKLSAKVWLKFMYYIWRNFYGLNEIEVLMHDPYIEDIGCTGTEVPIYIVHRKFGSLETNIVYNDFEQLNNFVVKLAERCGRYVTYAEPLLDGTLPDGSRVQATLAKDVTTKGPTFSIRKFRKIPFSPIDLMEFKTADSLLFAYLWFLIEHSASIMVCGAVATGKTTFLNSLTMFVPEERKIVSIEETREINIPHKNWIPAATRVGFGIPGPEGKKYGEIELFDLLKESFRMKPDYTIVGEVRGKEAYVLFQGMASGNPSMGTIHSGSVEDMIKRLETPPIELSPSLIEALDVVIVMTHAVEKGKSARRVKSVNEIESIDITTGRARVVKTFTWIPVTDDFRENIAQSHILRRLSFETGISFQKIIDEIENRKKVLEWAARKKISQYDQFCSIVNLYYRDKDTVLDWVKKDIKPRILPR
ncbi:MAG: type II/IV secretion system ATPase subunit [Candidatus Aenigmatarchaeota archaeon]